MARQWGRPGNRPVATAKQMITRKAGPASKAGPVEAQSGAHRPGSTRLDTHTELARPRLNIEGRALFSFEFWRFVALAESNLGCVRIRETCCEHRTVPGQDRLAWLAKIRRVPENGAPHQTHAAVRAPRL